MDPLDHDSLWKTAIDPFPRSLLELTFPEVTGRIDGSAKPESLEQELQKLGPESKIGDRHVDKLLKVRLLDGPGRADPPVGLRSPSRPHPNPALSEKAPYLLRLPSYTQRWEVDTTE